MLKNNIKYIVYTLFFIFTHLLNANEVNNLLEIEKKINLIKTKNNIEKNILNELLKKETKNIVILSNDIKLNHNKFLYLKSFYNKSIISTLKRKISLNKERKNKEELLKNEIELNYYNFITHINEYIKILNNYYKNNTKEKEIKISLKEELIYLKELKKQLIIYKNEIHNEIDEKNIKEIKLKKIYTKKYEEYELLYQVYNIYINYLLDNVNIIFSKNALMNIINLNTFINYINGLDYFQKINLLIKDFYYINIGKIILLSLIITLLILMNIIIIKIIANKVKKRIEKEIETNEIFEILNENYEKIKQPVFYLLNILTIDIGFQIIYYPEDISEKLSIFIYILYSYTWLKLLLNITNMIFEIYFQNKINTKTALREEIINLGNQIVKVILIISFLLMFLLKINIEISGFLASLGIGGLAFALAAKDTISNFFGSIKIILDEPFSQGDWIAIDKTEGTVIEIGLISTKIRTFENAMVTIPNGLLANMTVINWNKRKQGRRIKMYIGITYESNINNIQKAVKEIKEMLLTHKDIAKPNNKQNTKLRKSKNGKLVNIEEHYGIKKTLLVYIDKLNSSSIDILIYTFTKSTKWEDWLETKEDIILKIMDIIKNNNLELAYDTKMIHINKKD